MRTPRNFLGWVIMTGAALAAQGAFAQEQRGSNEQRMACTPDVMRLCSDQIPDSDRIVACLRQNTAMLSSGCRAVFDPGTTGQSTAQRPGQPMPRARGPQPPMQVQPVPPPRPYYNNDDDDD